MRLTPSYFTKLGIDRNWLKLLQPVLSSPEMYNTMNTIEKLNKTSIVFPERKNWFYAFNVTPLDELKVLILGQDPYHTYINNKPVAHGLAFSYQKSDTLDVYEPPSLKNILKEVEQDIHDGMCFGECLETDLTRWSKQGVLLLNTALTVQKGNAGSHTIYWKDRMKEIIKLISESHPGLIVMLWGNHAKSFKPILAPHNNILESGHPSPLSANKGLWFGNKHFSKANKIIEGLNGASYKIKW